MADEREAPDRLEIASAVILSVAALGSAWATYQAGLWDGEQAAHYSRANAQHIEASHRGLEGDLLGSLEVEAFAAWLNAKAKKDDALAGFYQARFPDHFKPSFNAWLAERPLTNPSAPPTPFATPAYRRPGQDAAAKLGREADELFAKGQYANAVSDAFQQGATVLAVALFFGGIGQVFRQRGTRIALLTVAGLALVAGLLRILSLPAQFLGLGPPGGG
jgi:hypothetical protein